MSSTDTVAGTANDHLGAAEELLGMVFSTPKDLRHWLEQVLGQEFVPVEVLAEGETCAELRLRPAGMGEIHVHAERERHWYPFQITHVDTVER